MLEMAIHRYLTSLLRLALAGFGLVPPAIALCTPAVAADIAPSSSPGAVEQTACRIIDGAARSSHIPVNLLTRLIWVESRFKAGITSPKGAQGIAQFMPGTATERGLLDPFDPEQAIPKAARLLADLNQRFGNIGLATAAYNAGSNSVADWLGATGRLPADTEAYVFSVTGRTAEDWAADRRETGRIVEPADPRSCIEITAALRAEEGADQLPLAPWGVQLSGNFSKAIAIASFERARQRYYGILGNLRPMIIGTVVRSRGTRPFYRVLVPASSRAEADQVCRAIKAGGGPCVALRT
jgi:hypothetical protein